MSAATVVAALNVRDTHLNSYSYHEQAVWSQIIAPICDATAGQTNWVPIPVWPLNDFLNLLYRVELLVVKLDSTNDHAAHRIKP